MPSRSSKRPRRSKYTAKTADPFELYQLSVQSPDDDIVFLNRVYKQLFGRAPRHFREDFCGTALLCATWVARDKRNTAEGFDLDPNALAWGQVHNLEPLGEKAQRVTLHMKDVREPGHKKAEVRVAQNFSYCIFKQREEMLAYFRSVREGLARDGMFALDLYGGYESTAEMEEERRIEGGFTYVWDQARFLPGSGDYLCHIHFRFRDGTELKKAFSYEWRYWTMPELKDILREAGFSQVMSYFEQGEGKDGEGNGQFLRDDTGKSCRDCAGWIAYMIATR